MPSSTFKSSDQLPVSLSVAQVAAYLGISKTTAYALFRSQDFPSLHVNRRYLIPKDRFLNWIDEQCGDVSSAGSSNRSECNEQSV